MLFMTKKKMSVGSAVDASRYPLEDVLRVSKSRAYRIFRGAWGKALGKLLAGKAVPWKGVTIGIEDTDEKIKKIKTINPKVAARNESFATDMKDRKNKPESKGVAIVRRPDGLYEIIPKVAAEVSQTATKKKPVTIVGTYTTLAEALQHYKEYAPSDRIEIAYA